MGGGRTFDDPNLILPGWELELSASSTSETVKANPAGNQVGADTVDADSWCPGRGHSGCWPAAHIPFTGIDPRHDEHDDRTRC